MSANPIFNLLNWHFIQHLLPPEFTIYTTGQYITVNKLPNLKMKLTSGIYNDLTETQ